MNKSEKQATVTVDNPIKTQQLSPHTQCSVETQYRTLHSTRLSGTRQMQGPAAAAGVHNARYGSLKIPKNYRSDKNHKP